MLRAISKERFVVIARPTSIADAIVYLLATSNCGMRTETIAREINLRGLHHRKDGKPVTSEQVYAVCMANKGVFCKDGGLIRLLM